MQRSRSAADYVEVFEVEKFDITRDGVRTLWVTAESLPLMGKDCKRTGRSEKIPRVDVDRFGLSMLARHRPD